MRTKGDGFDGMDGEGWEGWPETACDMRERRKWNGRKGKGREGIQRGDGLRVIAVRFEFQYSSFYHWWKTFLRHKILFRSYSQLDFTLHFTILSHL